MRVWQLARWQHYLEKELRVLGSQLAKEGLNTVLFTAPLCANTVRHLDDLVDDIAR